VAQVFALARIWAASFQNGHWFGVPLERDYSRRELQRSETFFGWSIAL
jgi:hypothetical protein